MTLGDFIYYLCWISMILYAFYNRLKISEIRKNCRENHITERECEFIDQLIDLTPEQDAFVKTIEGLDKNFGILDRVRYKLSVLKDREVHKCQK